MKRQYDRFPYPHRDPAEEADRPVTTLLDLPELGLEPFDLVNCCDTCRPLDELGVDDGRGSIAVRLPRNEPVRRAAARRTG